MYEFFNKIKSQLASNLKSLNVDL